MAPMAIMKRKRANVRFDIILLFVAAVAFSSSTVINSCASTGGSAEEGELGEVQENQPTAAGEGGLAELNEPPPSDASGELPAEQAPLADVPPAELPPADGQVESGNAPLGPAGISRIPEIPTEPVQKKGALLNRFYFSRKGDTPSSVSSLLYSSGAKAKLISAWNGRLRPGKVLLYESAVQPQDGQMKSYYEEAALTPQAYTVKKGDWLSRIATRQLGDRHSWIEIAVLNGISSPDAIEVGQKLNLYMTLTGGNLAAGAGAGAPPPAARETQPQQAANEPPPQASPPVNAEEPPPTPVGQPEDQIARTDSPPSSDISQAEPTPQDTPTPRKKKKSNGAALDIARFLQQNVLFLVFGAAISALLLALLLVRRKKKAQEEGFDDEGLARAGAKRR